MTARRTLVPLLAVVLAAATAAGCGGGSKSKTQSTSQAAATPPAATPTQPPAQTQPADRRLAKKPKVKVPSGKAPSQLVVKDLIKGKGAEARPGQTVSVQYVGVLYKNGKQFDASWDRGQPFTFPLGAGQVIPGWDRGVPGMKVGGRRELIIPAKLAYGANGPPGIGPNQALVFVVDLLNAG
jgi:peptidylprolyl isomerase